MQYFAAFIIGIGIVMAGLGHGFLKILGIVIAILGAALYIYDKIMGLIRLRKRRK